MALSQSWVEERLHAAPPEEIETTFLTIAIEATGASHAALFTWDEAERALRLDVHIVDHVPMTAPGLLLRPAKDGSAPGIALWVQQHNRPYLCDDTTADPHYTRYLVDVRSIAAVPLPYQRRSLGVLSVSSLEASAVSQATVETLEVIAAAGAKFLRRAQLYRSSEHGKRRPFMIKGLSPEWLHVERQIERVAATHMPVLVQGESGTGKELVAHAIHFNSARSDGPFVSVSCAAIPDPLLESTLFGHVRGAFTGATFHKVGEFEKAHGGTLFLDEVGELALPLQAKLLRAIETREIQPLGSNAPPKAVDVRLVCATLRDLPAMVRAGTFREDLYFRIGVVTLELPPLRHCKSNLEVVAEVYLRRAAQEFGRPGLRLSPEASSALMAYDFPGNLRELRNCMEHAAAMATGNEIVADDLPRSLRPAARATPTWAPEKTLAQLRDEWLAPLEQRYLVDLLTRHHGNVREAAKHAGINVVTLYRLLKKRGLFVGREVRLDPAASAPVARAGGASSRGGPR